MPCTKSHQGQGVATLIVTLVASMALTAPFAVGAVRSVPGNLGRASIFKPRQDGLVDMSNPKTRRAAEEAGRDMDLQKNMKIFRGDFIHCKNFDEIEVQCPWAQIPSPCVQLPSE